jgi:hypothetical protein
MRKFGVREARGSAVTPSLPDLPATGIFLAGLLEARIWEAGFFVVAIVFTSAA